MENDWIKSRAEKKVHSETIAETRHAYEFFLFFGCLEMKIVLD